MTLPELPFIPPDPEEPKLKDPPRLFLGRAADDCLLLFFYDGEMFGPLFAKINTSVKVTIHNYDARS